MALFQRLRERAAINTMVNKVNRGQFKTKVEQNRIKLKAESENNRAKQAAREKLGYSFNKSGKRIIHRPTSGFSGGVSRVGSQFRNASKNYTRTIRTKPTASYVQRRPTVRSVMYKPAWNPYVVQSGNVSPRYANDTPAKAQEITDVARRKYT